MKYPKAIMSKTELIKMGYSREFINRIVNCKYAEEFCFRHTERGKVYFDTEQFEKLRLKGLLTNGR